MVFKYSPLPIMLTGVLLSTPVFAIQAETTPPAVEATGEPAPVASATPETETPITAATAKADDVPTKKTPAASTTPETETPITAATAKADDVPTKKTPAASTTPETETPITAATAKADDVPTKKTPAASTTPETEAPITAATAKVDDVTTKKTPAEIASTQNPVALNPAPVATSSTSVAATASKQIPATQNAKDPALAPATILEFTPEQEVRIGEVVKAYLLEHPEVLLEVSKKLQTQQHEQQLQAITRAVLAHQDALLNDLDTPSYGPVNAKVAVVEFFDYQCSICAHQAPTMEALMQANPQVRFIFKEWPIFGARWPASLKAAEFGLQIWKQKGADAYIAYHNAVFALGHNEGDLTQQDIRHAAIQAGKLKGKKAEMLDTLAETDVLAQNLGFHGTPALIVMPVTDATADNVTVVQGGANQQALQVAISKASGE